MRTALLAWAVFAVPFCRADEPQTPWWSADVESALKQAGPNRAELESALAKAPAAQRAGIAFLVANMPDRDLKRLTAKFLLDNLALAYEARETSPWGKSVPEELFFNDVLPYASVSEKREDWRNAMRELCKPMVKDCKTLAEAAQAINAKLFGEVKVKYSTLRGRPDQAPAESMKSGIASCTGLSILLVDACRSVGVPARIVGIPQWPNKPGNHTWVEIWDGNWHFTGACEPDPKGLDRGWFVGDAALAKKDSEFSAIYASSYRKTKTRFPLVWEPGAKDISAENVTERYTAKKVAADKTRVMVRVVNAAGKRITVPVSISEADDASKTYGGKSKDEGADTNDFLTFDLPRKKEFSIRIGDPIREERKFSTEDRDQLKLDFVIKADGKMPLVKDLELRIRDEAAKFFAASEKERAGLKFDAECDSLLVRHEGLIRQILWEAYKSSPIHADLKADREKKQVRHDKYTAPYTVKTVGKLPSNGWPLFIAMHGGGNAPQELNDSQWKQMQIYYRDHPELGGYLYVALRAPNNTWNGFYDDYVPPLIVELIKQFTIVDGADPDKVFIMGYSHGGYGAFYLGPKMPDRFAAIHASAAAPTDGTISAKNLRNTRFTYMIGGADTAFGRRERCEKFAKEIDELKKANPGDYPVAMDLKEGRPHSGLPDRDMIKEMYSYVRNPVPKHLTWEPMDTFMHDFFWIGLDKPEKGQFVDLKVEGGKVSGVAKGVKKLVLNLDSRLLGSSEVVEFDINGEKSKAAVKPSLMNFCSSMLRRGDPALATCCSFAIDLK